MNNILAVTDIARDCKTNIALDEVFFTEEDFKPIIRFYTWTKPAYTIGYFQKYSQLNNQNNYDIVRRLTGGLAVLHNKDLSYSFIVSSEQWEYIYNQEETYKIIHTEMKKSLYDIGIKCDENQAENKTPNNFSCVNTFYKDDIFLEGRKLIGSCQRRRGKRLLVEGSIHLQMTQEQIVKFTDSFFYKISSFLNGKIIKSSLENSYLNKADILIKNKYNNDKWVKLF